MMDLAETIRQARTEKGWRQEDLAEHLGCSRQLVSQIEGGVLVPDDPRLRDLIRLLGLSADRVHALAGRLAPDVAEALQKQPERAAEIRALLGVGPWRARRLRRRGAE